MLRKCSEAGMSAVSAPEGLNKGHLLNRCGHCKHLTPEYKKLGESVASSPKLKDRVVIAKVTQSLSLWEPFCWLNRNMVEPPKGFCRSERRLPITGQA